MGQASPAARRWRRAAVVATALSVLVLAGTQACTSGGTGQELLGPPPNDAPPDTAFGRAADPVGALGASVLGALATSRAGNVAVAPVVLATQLASVRAGANGDTATAFDNLVPAPPGAPPAFAGPLGLVGKATVALNRRSGEQRSAARQGSVEFIAEATLWVQRGTEIDPVYLAAVETGLPVGVRAVDFRSNADSARAAINRWVADRTGGRTAQLVSRGEVRPTTQLVSTGAQWLAAPWLWPFDPLDTQAADFTTDTGRTTPVPMMRLGAPGGIGVTSDGAWQAVELPYLGGSLAMLVVLGPNSTEPPGPDQLSRLRAGLRPGPVVVRLPRFSFTSRETLTGPLAELGVGGATDREQADLTVMAPLERLALSEVVHEVFIAASEDGSAATAVTALTGGGGTPPGAETMVFDRPFWVVVIDRPTGLPLVMARVADPGT